MEVPHLKKGKPEPAKPKAAAKPKISLTRSYQVPLKELWDLWTTKAGLESWWGPQGFKTKVNRLDVTPGGGFEYAMTATNQDQIVAMTSMGLPLTSVARGTYVEVTAQKRLSYKTLVDFIPGVEPYEVLMEVDFHSEGGVTTLVVNEDVMHDMQWTNQSGIGLSQQFDKLANFLDKST